MEELKQMLKSAIKVTLDRLIPEDKILELMLVANKEYRRARSGATKKMFVIDALINDLPFPVNMLVKAAKEAVTEAVSLKIEEVFTKFQHRL